MGTEEGLFRYDGYNYLRIRHYPVGPGSLPNNNIEFLRADNDGRIWVGSRGGLSSVDGQSLQIRNYPGPHSFTVYSLVSWEDSTMLVGTSDGLYTFSRVSGTWHRIPLFPDNLMIRSLATGRKGELYVASHKGIYIVSRNLTLLRHVDVPVSSELTQQICHRVMVDSNGIAWFSTWNAGLLRYDPATDKITTCFPDAASPGVQQQNTLYDFLQEGNSKIVAANAESGITVINLEKHHSTSTRVSWDVANLIPIRVYSLFRDRSGILWVGTENGIYKGDPNLTSFRTIDFRENGSDFRGNKSKSPLSLRPDMAPCCLLTDRQGLWWIGTYEGLFLVDPATGLITNYSAQAGIPRSTLVSALYQDPTGDIWACAHHRLIRLHKTVVGGKVALRPSCFTAPAIQTTITALCFDQEK